MESKFMKYGIYNYAGIPKIKIPENEENITIQTIQNYLPEILQQFDKRVEKIKFLKLQFQGFQEIYNKVRKIETKDEYNNKTVENHAQYQVNFKKGLLKPMEFSYKNAQKEDDLTIFNRYLTDTNYHSVQNDLREDIYTIGMGTSYLQQNYSKIKSKTYNPDNEAPFIYEKVDPTENFVVYSSIIGSSDTRLFAVNISETNTFNIDKSKTTKKVYTIYTKNSVFKFDKDYNIIMQTLNSTSIKGYPNLSKQIPIVEHCYNQDRMGIVEVNIDLYHLINLIISNSADNIVDNANNIIIINEAEISEDDLKDMFKAGAILLKSTNPNHKAGAETLHLQFDHEKINVFYEQRLARIYSIVGVPIPTTSSSSGGDTQGARMLGGGWTSAYTIIGQEILGLLRGDREVLRQMFSIAKSIPGSKIKEIHENQIEIKYTINQNDNIQVKAQALMNMKTSGVPVKHIVSAVGIWSDEATVVNSWESEDIKNKEQLTKPVV